MCFLSQFPAARKFIVEIVKQFSNGWAQGFVFTYSEDKGLQWEEEGDDTCVNAFLTEVLEIICRAYGHRADVAARGTYSLAVDVEPLYAQLHNMTVRCKAEKQLFAPDVLNNFSKFGYWGPSYSFTCHALREAVAYAKFRRNSAFAAARPGE